MSGKPQPCAERAERERCKYNLRAAEPEDQPPHAPQAGGLELQPHEEQQERNPELSEPDHVLGVGHDGKSPRTEQHSGGKVAEHGTEFQPLKERDENDDSQQKNRGELMKVHKRCDGWW